MCQCSINQNVNYMYLQYPFINQRNCQMRLITVYQFSISGHLLDLYSQRMKNLQNPMKVVLHYALMSNFIDSLSAAFKHFSQLMGWV